MYVYADDARHGHVTLTKFCETHNYITPAKALLPSRETWCTPAEPEEKRIGLFLNRFVGELPIGLVEFSWYMYLVQAFV